MPTSYYTLSTHPTTTTTTLDYWATPIEDTPRSQVTAFEYQRGDEVTIVDSWSNDDWQCNFNSDEMDQYVHNGKTYEVIEISELDDGHIYMLSNHYWWYAFALQPSANSVDINTPHWKVIRKIKRMQQKRKELGYAF